MARAWLGGHNSLAWNGRLRAIECRLYMSRKHHGKRAPLPHGTGQSDAAAMNFHQLLGYRKPNARAATRARSRLIDAIEAVEDSPLMLRRYAHAAVAYGDGDPIVLGVGGNLDAAAGRGVVQGVAQQVQEYLA